LPAAFGLVLPAHGLPLISKRLSAELVALPMSKQWPMLLM
jgi:hypothetical protein